ncbi:hypothetical protein [Pseudidiomarina sp. CB1]|uniref:hypothetical protein n=1 Tax=Pseudidiomarina sp. CB1 TaxID=2972484 RepID=UPI002162A3CC|nr:hypothetical protein [Pseudidiomarina sp. CB1]
MKLGFSFNSLERNAIAIAALVAVLCVVDFSQRVWLSTPDNSGVERELAAAQVVNHQAPVAADELQQWWQQRAEERQAATDAAQQQNTPTAKPLLEGGIDVGPLRIRLRAIVIATDSQQQVAIMEAQNTDDRSLEFIERRVGENLGDYRVTAIRVNEIVFTQGDESITVPIFDYDR